MITPADSAPAAPAQVPASSWDIQAPYSGGAPSGIYTGGDQDPAGTDDVAATVAAAQAAAEARFTSHMHDTYGQGSQIGDTVSLPPQDFSVATAHQAGYTGSQ